MIRLWDGFKTGLIVGVGLTVILMFVAMLGALRCLPGQVDLEIADRELAPLRCTVEDRRLTLSSSAQPGYAVHLVDRFPLRGWLVELVRPSGVTQLQPETCSTLDVDAFQYGTQYATGKLVIDCPDVIGRVDLGACK